MVGLEVLAAAGVDVQVAAMLKKLMRKEEYSRRRGMRPLLILSHELKLSHKMMSVITDTLEEQEKEVLVWGNAMIAMEDRTSGHFSWICVDGCAG